MTFEKDYEKLKELVKERKINFIGLGMMPYAPDNGIDFEVWDLLGKCLENEDFAEHVRKQMLGDDF